MFNIIYETSPLELNVDIMSVGVLGSKKIILFSSLTAQSFCYYTGKYFLI